MQEPELRQVGGTDLIFKVDDNNVEIAVKGHCGAGLPCTRNFDVKLDFQPWRICGTCSKPEVTPI